MSTPGKVAEFTHMLEKLVFGIIIISLSLYEDPYIGIIANKIFYEDFS